MTRVWGTGIARLRRLLPRARAARLPRHIMVVSVPKKEAVRLSRRFHKVRTPVNVLSFRYGPDYGEIIVCPEVIRRDAVLQGNTYTFQMTWMLVHGILHLAGVHHEKSRTIAEKSERWERTILKKIFGSDIHITPNP